MSIFSIAAKGGFIMILLFAISIFAVAIIIERIIKLKKAKTNEDEFLGDIYSMLGEGDYKKALRLCQIRESSPVARICAKGLWAVDLGMGDVKEAVETAAGSELHALQKNLGTLSTFSAIAPLLGFLGTVTGMVKVFKRIQETGGGVDISLLAGGIWEAMITTIGGLAVGILTILCYNYLISKIEEITIDLEEKSTEFILRIRNLK
ncbi:MAG: biopolymer transporter ExbB [Candidatus Cloacimonadota bacterium]|nr:MAG: biopolymer transporter ExbB [Candidatus Cloacimonadota bacterium]